jgi:hypothetical protein
LPSAQQEQQLLAEEVKGRVLAISVSIKTFTDPPPADSGFVFDIDVCSITFPFTSLTPPTPPPPCRNTWMPSRSCWSWTPR